MAAAPEGEPETSEPLKYKTWVLKVSIHCEGCKRKVKRILHNVEGVYTIDVDTKQHKVIVTGNVDANTLLRKLEKSGKHAELWPDFYQNNCKKNDAQNFQEQQQNQPQNQNQNQNPNPNIENPKVTISVEEQQKEPQKAAENSGQQQPQVKEVRFEGNIPANGESQNAPPNNGGGGGGAKKKKKKKKGHNGNNSNNGGANNNNVNVNNNGGSGEPGGGGMEHGSNGGVQTIESHPPQQQQQNPNQGPCPGPAPGQGSGPGYMGSPHYPQNNRVYEYPPAYYAPPTVYAVNYNTAYPSSSYSASYYSAPTPYSYAYVHDGGDVEPPAPLDWNPHAVPPSDSFEMFSDENPNACSLM